MGYAAGLGLCIGLWALESLNDEIKWKEEEKRRIDKLCRLDPKRKRFEQWVVKMNEFMANVEDRSVYKSWYVGQKKAIRLHEEECERQRMELFDNFPIEMDFFEKYQGDKFFIDMPFNFHDYREKKEIKEEAWEYFSKEILGR